MGNGAEFEKLVRDFQVKGGKSLGSAIEVANQVKASAELAEEHRGHPDAISHPTLQGLCAGGGDGEGCE